MPGAPMADGGNERILILAPKGRDAALAASVLRSVRLEVAVCSDMDDLTRSLTQGAGAAVIAQEALTPPELDSLARTLERQPPWADLPLVILTGSGRATETGEALLMASERLGNATFLERPLRIATLIRAVKVALRTRRRQYEIRTHLGERERAATERLALMEQQRAFLRDVLSSVTEGKLCLCDGPDDLPPRLTDSVGETVPLSRQTLYLLRRSAMAAAEERGFSSERTDDLATAANEAGMNAIVHTGDGTGYVRADATTIQVWVEDRGGGIDMASLPRATLERGFTTAGTLGHGFWLILKMVDRTYLLTGPGGTTVVLEQNRMPPVPAWAYGL